MTPQMWDAATCFYKCALNINITTIFYMASVFSADDAQLPLSVAMTESKRTTNNESALRFTSKELNLNK